MAEYHPLENKYYYHTTDQINSTRIVTDDNGTVVYAAAHDPYGGIQHNWVNSFDPVLKFSGKEWDEESGVDYFGARYYNYTLYRFLSVDPVIPAGRALYNPQRWNLYGYCGNNRLNYVDWTGGDDTYYLHVKRFLYSEKGTFGVFYLEHDSKIVQFGFTLEPLIYKGKGPIPEGTYTADVYLWAEKQYRVLRLHNVPNFKGIYWHGGNSVKDTTGCTLPGLTIDLGRGWIGKSRLTLEGVIGGVAPETVFSQEGFGSNISIIVSYTNAKGWLTEGDDFIILVIYEVLNYPNWWRGKNFMDYIM